MLGIIGSFPMLYSLYGFIHLNKEYKLYLGEFPYSLSWGFWLSLVGLMMLIVSRFMAKTDIVWEEIPKDET